MRRQKPRTIEACAIAASSESPAISCAAASLYGSGGFPGEPDTLRTLIERGPAADFLGEVFPAASYQRPPPRTIVAHDAGFREQVAGIQADINLRHGSIPASALVALDDVVLKNNVLFTGPAADRHVVFETARPSDRIVTTSLAAEEPILAFEGEGPVLFVGSIGSFNYGHWLIDDLPRLRAVALLQERYPGKTVTVVLTGYGRRFDAVRKTFVDLYVGQARRTRVVFAGRDRALGFARLHYQTPVTDPPLTKSPGGVNDMVRTLRERTITHRRRAHRWSGLLRRSAPSGMLFVDRRSGRTRQIVNKDEIVSALKRKGFDVVDPEGMSIERQISTFSNARVVVGILGAAMTNTVFCRPGTQLVYLAPEGWFDPFFWDLAAVRRHAYHLVCGRLVPGDDEASPHQRSFTLDWADLAGALARAGH